MDGPNASRKITDAQVAELMPLFRELKDEMWELGKVENEITGLAHASHEYAGEVLFVLQESEESGWFREVIPEMIAEKMLSASKQLEARRLSLSRKIYDAEKKWEGFAGPRERAAGSPAGAPSPPPEEIVKIAEHAVAPVNRFTARRVRESLAAPTRPTGRRRPLGAAARPR